MIVVYSVEQTLAIVTRLSPAQLDEFVNAEAVTPLIDGDVPTFRQSDIARLELLCDLAETYDLQADALALVISLVDQLHATRSDLEAVLAALADAPDDLRGRIAATLRDRT
ncbi:MAG: hypothetical protein ABI459_11925 [Deltaproteobacteria bacterium]